MQETQSKIHVSENSECPSVCYITIISPMISQWCAQLRETNPIPCWCLPIAYRGLLLVVLRAWGVDAQGIVNPLCGFGVGSGASCGSGVAWGGRDRYAFSDCVSGPSLKNVPKHPFESAAEHPFETHLPTSLKLQRTSLVSWCGW